MKPYTCDYERLTTTTRQPVTPNTYQNMMITTPGKKCLCLPPYKGTYRCFRGKGPILGAGLGGNPSRTLPTPIRGWVLDPAPCWVLMDSSDLLQTAARTKPIRRTATAGRNARLTKSSTRTASARRVRPRLVGGPLNPTLDSILVATLDQPCEIDAQCAVVYSQCQAGACKCKAGFTAKDGMCESNSHFCQYGEVVKGADGAVRTCKIVGPSTPWFPSTPTPMPGPAIYALGSVRGLQDTCGTDQWCQATGHHFPYVEGFEGFCCTKPKIGCPTGEPYGPAPYCNGTVFMDGSSGPSPMGPGIPVDSPFASQTCPSTHECVMTMALPLEPPLCCPKLCNAGQINVNGRCYQRRQYGDSCQVDEQCQDHRGSCIGGMHKA